MNTSKWLKLGSAGVGDKRPQYLRPIAGQKASARPPIRDEYSDLYLGRVDFQKHLSYATSRVCRKKKFFSIQDLSSQAPLDFVNYPEFREFWFLFTATYPFLPMFSEMIWLCCFGKDWDSYSIIYGNDDLV